MLMYFPQFRGLDVGNGQRPCGQAEGLGHAPTPPRRTALASLSTRALVTPGQGPPHHLT